MITPLISSRARFLCLSVALGFTLFFQHVRAETVLVSETFADGERTTNHLPNSLNWYCSASSKFLTVTPGAMTLTGAEQTARHAVAYFAPPDHPISLQVGQSLLLSFQIRPSETMLFSGNSLRVGLFNSANDAANILSRDGENPSGASASGYVGSLGTKSETSATLGILKRSGLGGLLTNSTAYKTEKSKGISSSIVNGQLYSVTLKVHRLAQNKVEATFTLSGGDLSGEVSISHEDQSDIVTSFDMVGVSIFRSIPTAEFSDFRLTLLP